MNAVNLVRTTTPTTKWVQSTSWGLQHQQLNECNPRHEDYNTDDDDTGDGLVQLNGKVIYTDTQQGHYQKLSPNTVS